MILDNEKEIKRKEAEAKILSDLADRGIKTSPKEKTTRPDKINYYLNIAEVVASRSTCLRKNWGAVVVKNDNIVSTGYNGAPRGRKNCVDIGSCIREELNIPRGERYELCRSVHAEANAIISASGAELIDSDLYLVGMENNGDYVHNPCSCSMCKRLIINAGIKKVHIRIDKEQFKSYLVRDWVYDDESLAGTKGY